ncbi:UNVERIFIED_CONTAM: hypothetical protein Sindi_0857500 [Sesamum indicum]
MSTANTKDTVSEYQRGVSAWNFDVEDLKFQASLLQEEDEIQEIKEEEDSVKYHTNHKVASSSVVKQEATGNNSSRYEIENQQLAEKVQQVRRQPSFSGPLNLPNRASGNSLSAPIKSSGGFKDSLEDKTKTNLVQIKGRFSVTSENVDLVKGSPLRKSASVGNWIFDSKQMPNSQPVKEIGNSNVPASVLMPQLQNLFQQTSIQQDLIMNLLSSLQLVEIENAPQNGKLPPLPRSENNGSVSTYFPSHFELFIQAELVVSERERMLLTKISELQARMISLTDELTAEKVKYTQLQQQLHAVSGLEDDGDR